jgi:hypothetical protein
MAIQIDRQWLEKVGGIKVERTKEDGGKLPNVKRSHVRISARQEENGVLHTTEGHFAGSYAVFQNNTGTPTWMLGYETLKSKNGKLTNEPAEKKTPIRVVQFMPIGEMALTLVNLSGGTETNREAVVQIELIGTCVVGHLGTGPWLPDEPVLEVLADLFRQIHDSCGVPLVHAGNGTRSVARWDGKAGWFGHGEVPENGHTDPRGFKWEQAFEKAAPKQDIVWQIRSDGKTLKQFSAEVGPPSGYDRLITWMTGPGETKVRQAEQESGAVSIRKVPVPAK